MSRHVSAEEKEVPWEAACGGVLCCGHPRRDRQQQLDPAAPVLQPLLPVPLDVVTPREVPSEALEEANAWEPLQQSKGRFDAPWGIPLTPRRVGRENLRGTRAEHPEHLSPACLSREEDLNGLYEAERPMAEPLYALAKLGSEILAENIFRPSGTTLEARIRSWALFSLHLRTLGRGPLVCVPSCGRRTP